MTRRRRRWRNVVNPRSGTPCRRRRWISIEWIRRRRRWRIRIINRRRWWRRNRVDHGRNSAPHHSDDSRGERDAVVAVTMRRRRRRCKYAPAYGDGTDCCQKKFHCFHDGTSLCVWFRPFFCLLRTVSVPYNVIKKTLLFSFLNCFSASGRRGWKPACRARADRDSRETSARRWRILPLFRAPARSRQESVLRME